MRLVHLFRYPGYLTQPLLVQRMSGPVPTAVVKLKLVLLLRNGCDVDENLLEAKLLDSQVVQPFSISASLRLFA